MEAWEYRYIRREILQLTGVDLDSYKSTQIQRRLASYLQKSGHGTWASLFNSLRRTPGAAEQLKNYLTIGVSAFFRDPEMYACLQHAILPGLVRQGAALRVWSAGCSRGQEPYSLAMLLNESCSPHLYHRILATDLDSAALEWARAGGPYSAGDVSNVAPDLARRYLDVRVNGVWVREQLRQQVFFRRHDLLQDPFDHGFDLIVCRNVTIYFTGEAKAALYRRFHAAQNSGGVLFVGGTELMARPQELGFEAIGSSFYRRRIGA